MGEGAVGFSTGLTYHPADCSDTDELIAICRVVREHDGIFLVHKRDNFAFPRDCGDAETVRIIRETGVRTHILHYKTGHGNPGDIDSLLEPYMPVLNGGYDVSFEFYPYHAGAGFGIVFLPPWAMEGGYDAVMARLRDPSLRQRLAEGVGIRYPFLMPEQGVTFTALKHTREYEGATLAQVCALRGQEPIEALLNLLDENELELGYYVNPPEESDVTPVLEDDFFRLLDHPNYTIGSDSISYGSHAHPRAFGSFTRLLRLSRESGYPLERLVHKITKYTAGRYRLKGKGEIAPGMDADLCVFDYKTVTDHAAYGRSRRMSTGMRYVLVGGRLALDEGQVTGLLAGRALRHAR